MIKFSLQSAIALLFLLCTQAISQPKPLTALEVKNLKKLAAQSVLHVETGLKKIKAAGTTGDPVQMKREVSLPAAALVMEWRSLGLTDAALMPYSSCRSILGDLQVYAEDSLRPPKYNLSDMAQQKLKFINEDLVDCRKLRS
jgi:hypothetical protein